MTYPTFDTWFLIGSKFTDMVHDGKLDWNRVELVGRAIFVLINAIAGRRPETRSLRPPALSCHGMFT